MVLTVTATPRKRLRWLLIVCFVVNHTAWSWSGTHTCMELTRIHVSLGVVCPPTPIRYFQEAACTFLLLAVLHSMDDDHPQGSHGSCISCYLRRKTRKQGSVSKPNVQHPSLIFLERPLHLSEFQLSKVQWVVVFIWNEIPPSFNSIDRDLFFFCLVYLDLDLYRVLTRSLALAPSICIGHRMHAGGRSSMCNKLPNWRTITRLVGM